jgi:hypothetical protein
MHLTRSEFGTWLGNYIAAWRSGDPGAIGELFSADAVYSFRGGTTVVSGREAIVAAWLGEGDDDRWEAHYEALAIDEDAHVSIGWSRYFDDAGAVRDEYSNIFLCRFDDRGRCREFTEWWMRTAGNASEQT